MKQTEELDIMDKVKWRMKYDRNPIFPVLLDKYAVRKYAMDRGIKVPELIWMTRHPETIFFRKSPEEFFLKATHGCNWNLHVKDGISRIYRGRTKDLEDIDKFLNRRITIELCKKWLKSDFSKNHGEWGYSKIPPRLIAEEVLKESSGKPLVDYKCFTFDGKVALIYAVDEPSRFKNRACEYRDTKWNRVKLTKCRDPFSDPPISRPHDLDEIVHSAEVLGKGLDFCRIDLYSTTKGVVFGEMTIYPQAGIGPLTGCPIFDKRLSEKWPLPGRAVFESKEKALGALGQI